MSAFDTYTNTGSTSFTNSYGTVELLPSGTAQYARGFQRSDSRRYFEVYVDDAGGDNSKLLVGLDVPPGWTTLSPVWGGANTASNLSGAVLNPVYPYNPSLGTITVATGDVLMFHIDIGTNTTGVNQAGVAVGGTISSGTGELLTPIAISVGKNGSWVSNGHVTFGWPAHGYPVRARPLVVRDSTSAATAKVSLRVETLSFVYGIPSGAIAWGDGPEGGTSGSIDWTPGWDATSIGTDQTLTFSTLGHDLVSAGTSFSVASVKSTSLLPTTGKRVVEFWGQFGLGAAGGGHFDQTLSATGSGAAGDFRYYYGLCDSTMTSISWSPSAVKGNIAWGTDRKRRGVSKVTSITNVVLGGSSYWGKGGAVMYIDFDAQRLWTRGGPERANGLTAFWSGRTISASGPDPYIGRDGCTFSYSGSAGLKLIAWDRKDFGSGRGNTIYMNAGQYPFRTFPLLPGWVSMDGSRQVAGNGSVWDTSVMPSSLSVCYSGLGVRKSQRATADNPLVRNTVSKSSGKWYYEIFHDNSINTGAGGTLSCGFGLLPTSVGTFTANSSETSHGAVGLFCDVNSRDRYRYGVQSSISFSITITGGAIANGTNRIVGCAVDFDNGRVWFGIWNSGGIGGFGRMAWAVGADPTTGTNPDLTFTAASPMYIATLLGLNSGGTADGWAYLVAESGNCIGTPSGFTPWNGSGGGTSLTSTPSGTSSGTGSGGGRVLWPYGVQT